ncbi:MAG TPA: hypothetical protein VJN96_07040 [Vicinamibacterales bacterium]|nr:hypothetical protein [Vicinamibacterales bacterium]
MKRTSITDAKNAGKGRLERLERAGLAHRPSAHMPKAIVTSDPPAPVGRAKASEALIRDRREDQ